MENNVDYFKKLKIELQAIPFLGIYPKELKEGLEEIFVDACLQQHYSQEPKDGSNPRVQRRMKGRTKHSTDTQ